MTVVVRPVSSRAVQVIIGVDTHLNQHVAVAIDGQGVRLGESHMPATTCGYGELERWSRSLGPRLCTLGVRESGTPGSPQAA